MRCTAALLADAAQVVGGKLYMLGGGFDKHAHALLVRTNWIRTAGWSLRGLLVLAWLALCMP